MKRFRAAGGHHNQNLESSHDPTDERSKPFIPIALEPIRCQIIPVLTVKELLSGLLAVSLSVVAAEDPPEVQAAPAQPAQAPPGAPPIPADLLQDEHVREELAINEFTAPSIARIFDSLAELAPLPLADYPRKSPERMPLDRADLAVELGFLIADGFLVVQVGELGKVEELASELTNYSKALGAGDRVKRHVTSLLESARDGNVEQLKKELTATQMDVELELVALRDADLAHLISLGGWIRALEVASGAVDKQFSPDRARQIMREDIADYYSAIIGSLEPRIAERPSYQEMQVVLSGMRIEMLVEEGQDPTVEKVAEIKKQAQKLGKLALKRADKP